MEFQKKLKTRLYWAIICAVIGIALIILCALGIIDNQYFSSLGLIFVTNSIVHIRRYQRITKDEESIHRQYVIESDERNLTIWNAARNMTLSIYSVLMSVAVIILQILHKDEIAQILALSVCALIFIYWICYLLARRKY